MSSSTSEVTIKVSFSGSLRNVALSTVEQESWSAFQQKIRDLFSIPESAKIGAHYIDQDNDSITFDSDGELAAIFEASVSAKPNKIFITTDGGNDDTGNLPNKEKGKADENGSANNQNPFQSFFGKIDPMVTELNEEIKNSRIGSIVEEIAAEAKKHFEAGKYGSRFAGDGCGTGRSGFHPAFHGGFHPYANKIFGTTQQQRQQTWPPRWEYVSCDGCSTEGFTGLRFKCKTCANFDLCESCHAKAAEIHNSQHEFGEMIHPQQVAEDENLAALYGMGFDVEAEKARDLLRRYAGNTERVVDLLLREATSSA